MYVRLDAAHEIPDMWLHQMPNTMCNVQNDSGFHCGMCIFDFKLNIAF